jgi:hypothetical protein
MNDEKILLTADEAISLLATGEHIHNFINNVPDLFIDCDYDRVDAEKHIRDAIACEIAGPGCKSMKHALAVWSSNNNVSFFATDMDKVEAMEHSKVSV